LHFAVPSASFVYIIAVTALMYIKSVRYSIDMTAPKKEHQEKIADVRNALADAIEKARYYDETTVLTSRGKRVAVLVGMDFYERALEALGEERELVEAAPASKRSIKAPTGTLDRARDND
jgi:prevent-host-death family protein